MVNEKIISISGYLIGMFIAIFIGSWAIAYLVSKSENSNVDIEIINTDGTDKICSVYYDDVLGNLIISCNVPEGETIKYTILLTKEELK